MLNWKYMPIAYHGRASSIVISGTDIHRPKGQLLPPGAEQPVFGPSQKLDFELEMAMVNGKDSQLGQPVNVSEAEDYIFGFLLFNDWSARDIQKWEYVPLGPFLGKNFASTVSPWIVPLEALKPFQTDGPAQNPEPLAYLQQPNPRNFDLNLEVDLQPEGEDAQTISHSNFKNLYWSMQQMIAHHTVNGCNLRVGDLLASGTISGPTPDSYGSMLELSWNGEKPISLNSGTNRTFVNDGDTVRMRAFAEKDGIRIGFGEVSNQILPPL
jgi:fumarylacetoacetase